MKDDSQLIWEAAPTHKKLQQMSGPYKTTINVSQNPQTNALIAAQMLQFYLEEDYIHGDGAAALIDMRTDEGEETAFREAANVDRACKWISHVTGKPFTIGCINLLADMIEDMRRQASADKKYKSPPQIDNTPLTPAR